MHCVLNDGGKVGVHQCKVGRSDEIGACNSHRHGKVVGQILTSEFEHKGR